LQEARAVGFAKWRWTSAYAAISSVHPCSQILHDCPRCNRIADAGFGEGFAIVVEHLRLGFKAPFREQNIGGDDNALRIGILRNPIVSRVIFWSLRRRALGIRPAWLAA
jgi:hypothetical protein